MAVWAADSIEAWLVDQPGVAIWDVDFEVFVAAAALALVVIVKGFLL